MQEVGTIPAEVTTPPTLHRTTSPPVKEEEAMPVRGPVPSRNQC